MKNLLRSLLLLFLLLGLVLPEADAQRKKRKKKDKKERKKKGKTSKSEKKAAKADAKKWKKKLKALKPEQYKTLMEEYYSLKDRVSTAEESAGDCEASIEAKNKQLSQYQAEVKKLQADAKNRPKSRGSADVSGVTYRIQIGAYSEIDLSQYSGQENFKVEEGSGAQKFTIGLFRNYREADSLKKYLQRMGVRDAWVVAYRDGNRVDMKEVISGATGGDN